MIKNELLIQSNICKFIVVSKQGEFNSKGWKACITPIVYDEIEFGQEGAKASTTHANSLAHPRDRFHPNSHEQSATKVESKKGKATNKTWSEYKVVTSAHTQRRCYA
jgi:hypothetical protein